MTDVYFAALETERAKLDQPGQSFGYITSVENPLKGSTPGTVAEVSNSTAARMILEGTARVSTPEEIDSHLHRGPDGANPVEVKV